MLSSGTLHLAAGGVVSWRLSGALVALGGQLIDAHPGVVLGTIGDAAHLAQGRPSFDPATGRAKGGTDHEPDVPDDVVCALDVMHGTGGIDAHALFDVLRTWRHPALSYLELENVAPFGGHKMACGIYTGWAVKDSGPSSAGPHCHVSSLHGARGALSVPWTIAPPAPAPAPRPTLESYVDVFQYQHPGETHAVYGVAHDGTIHSIPPEAVPAAPPVRVITDHTAVIAYVKWLCDRSGQDMAHIS